MSTSDGAVEQLLSSKTATPIAQLSPDLPAQETRTIHGEITITWPYSFVTKTFAFLLAEPDFRLRRNKGQVRIQLQGPSAEAVGKWELGSGDEVTLSLDGVEWAKDDESARPAGSRSEWQLKFAGKLMLKATLGETQEKKFVDIDQPIPVIAPETPNPIPFAEIDLTIFDAPLAIEESPTPPAPPAPANNDEYASPMFMKRSRAYDPLFEVDLDDELEDDGGRKGKGRKRPRYSALNGRWRLNEDDSSPEPEQPEGTRPVASEQNEDVEMHDTPSRPSMADGGVQTNESDLAPVPSSPVNTPSKNWSGADHSLFSEVEVSRPLDAFRTDSGVQASPSRAMTSAPTEFHEKASTQVTPSLFGQVTQPSGFAGFGSSQQLSQNQGIGNTPSAFGAISAASSHQGFGGSASPFGAASHGPFSHGFGENTSPFGAASNSPANQGLGQDPSLLGSNPAQGQTPSPQISDVNNGFGATSGSVRFGFGQEHPSAFAASPLGTTQAPVQYAAESYPESSLSQQGLSSYSLNASHHPVDADIDDSPYGHGLEAPVEHTPPKTRTPEQNVPLWPMGMQSFDSSHIIGRVNPVEDIRSDDSDPERPSSGMIPPAVDDGTRNLDEMKQEGLLSRPVYRQGVSEEALPDEEDASAGEEDEPGDNDEQAAYHDSEKGDDYDLRNYDRVSDDEEGFDDEEPLSEDEMLDEGPEHWAGAEATYEEDDYDDDEEDSDDFNDYSQASGRLSQPQLPAQSPAQKNKIVIDLLSDSDDDEPAVPPIKAPRSQIPPHESKRLQKSDSVDYSETESVDQDDHQVAPTGPKLPTDGAAHEDPAESQEQANFEDAEDFEDEDGKNSDEEHLQDYQDSSELDAEMAESDDEGDAETQEAITVNPAAGPDLPPNSLDGSMDPEDGQEDTQADEENPEKQSKESTIVNGLKETDPRSDSDSRDVVVATDDGQTGNHLESFQTQPDDVIASFHFRVPNSPDLGHSSEGHAASDAPMQDVNDQKDSDAIGDDEPRQVASEIDRDEEVESDGIDHELRDSAERPDGPSFTETVEVMAKEITTGETGESQRVEVSSDQRDEPLASSMAQDQVGLTSAMSVVETSETTVFSYTEMNLSNQEVNFGTQEIEMRIQTSLAESVDNAVDSKGDSERQGPAEDTDVEMVDAGATVGSKLDTEQMGNPEPLSTEDGKEDSAVQCLTPSEMIEGSPKEEIDQVPAPEVTADAVPKRAAHENQRISTQDETLHIKDGNADDDDDDEFHEASEMAEQASTSPIARPEDSFVSIDSQASGTQDAEEAVIAPEDKPKRGGKKSQNPSGLKSAKSTSVSQKVQRQSSRQSSRRVTAQPAPSSQRATRSKTMSFQAASPKEDKEDMSIQLARAALKPPTPKKSKVSATAAKRLNTDLVERLENDLPDCVALNNLRKYNANFVDAAAVATSANIPPKRTPTREYASSFTITDPSIAPDGVVEVELYSLHKDHLPVVKTGDSILLRGFLVVSLPGRGFGLKTRDGSAWAVFKAEGDDEPEMKAAPVEMSDKEAKFMLDVRAWYSGLDDKEKGKVGAAVEEMIAAGKESRAKK